MDNDDRIDKSVPRTHKVALTCIHHTSLHWYTKNIDYIGARTLFYNPEQGKECPCPAADLVLVSSLDS